MTDCSSKPQSQDPSEMVERAARAIEAAFVSQSKAQYAEVDYPIITLDGIYQLEEISRAAIAAYEAGLKVSVERFGGHTFVEKFCATQVMAREGGNPWRHRLRELLPERRDLHHSGSATEG